MLTVYFVNIRVVIYELEDSLCVNSPYKFPDIPAES
jgi:hypothetical protein